MIVIVDDDEAIRLGLSSLLRSAGYRASHFASAETLLSSNDLGGVDLVITDIQMPGINGIELQRRLRQDYPSLPVIVMTAFPDPKIRGQALSNGAFRFFGKPFEAGAILEALEAALNDRSE